MARSQDGGEFSRPAKRDGDTSGNYQPLTVNDLGALIVQGAGVEPTATSLFIADGGGSGRRAVIDSTDALLVRDVATSGAGVSSANSLNTPLPAGGTFVGPWESTAGFAEIRGVAVTDAPSAAGGLVVDFATAPNEASWVKSEDSSHPGQGIGLHFAFQPEASWFRIRYTNGPTAQGYIRSEVSLQVRPGQASQLPLGAQVDDTNTAALGRVSLLARHASGAHLPLTTDGSGRLDVNTGLAPLTDAQLRATPVPVNTGLVIPQPQVDALTNAQLRATPVPVTISNPDEAGLTNAELRATPVPVTGPLTDSQLRATALPVSGPLTAFEAVNQPLRVREGLAYFASADGGRVAFNSSTNILTITATGEQPLAAFANPAGSGKDVVLWYGEFSSSANTNFRRYRGATVTFSAAAQDAANMGGGSTAAVGRLQVPGTYTATGGVVSKTAQIGAFAQYEAIIHASVRLRPGQAIRWTITGPGGLGGSLTAAVYLEWYEVPAT